MVAKFIIKLSSVIIGTRVGRREAINSALSVRLAARREHTNVLISQASVGLTYQIR